MMYKKIKFPFSNLSFENWTNLIIAAIIVFYVVTLGYAIGNVPIQSGFSGDYLAFWSAGKIANEKGYAQIYNLEGLKGIQSQELIKLGYLKEMDKSSYSPLPVALFPVFVFPFQILSNISIEFSYWIWTIINLMTLIGYTFFFKRKILPNNMEKLPVIRHILLLLISYPVWINFTEGQVNVFLVICLGEFIRQAIRQKPLLSGLWLGGLLLKPQLLILIIPTLLFLRYWKALSGFLFSSIIIFLPSLLLSGLSGMKALVDLWTKFSAGIATSSPDMMINWRMIGLNINSLFGTSFGWLVTGLGILLTIALIYHPIKQKPAYGGPDWIITMTAVFSATLAVTWHAHYHMAVVLIPFLIYASLLKLLPGKVIFSWATVTIILLTALRMISVLIFLFTKRVFAGIGYWVAISGFCLNLLIFISTLQYLHSHLVFHKEPSIGNPITGITH